MRPIAFMKPHVATGPPPTGFLETFDLNIAGPGNNYDNDGWQEIFNGPGVIDPNNTAGTGSHQSGMSCLLDDDVEIRYVFPEGAQDNVHLRGTVTLTGANFVWYMHMLENPGDAQTSAVTRIRHQTSSILNRQYMESSFSNGSQSFAGTNLELYFWWDYVRNGPAGQNQLTMGTNPVRAGAGNETIGFFAAPDRPIAAYSYGGDRGSTHEYNFDDLEHKFDGPYGDF